MNCDSVPHIENSYGKVLADQDHLIKLADLIYCAIDQIIKDDDMTKFNLKIIQDDIGNMLDKMK